MTDDHWVAGMDAYAVLTTTRAVRKRLDAARPVSRSVIEECIEVAAQAPTGGNRQRLQWVIVEEATVRDQVVGAFRDSAAEIYTTMASRAPTAASRRAYEGAHELLERLHTIPILAIPCMTRAPALPLEHAPAVGFYGSAIPAIWSFQLALRTRGLGSTFTSVHLRREREVAEVLGIPDDVRQMALLPVAYTIGQNFKPANRAPVTDIVSYNTWGAQNPGQ